MHAGNKSQPISKRASRTIANSRQIIDKSQKMSEQIQKINDEAYTLFQKKQFIQALTKMKQAEQLLQYAAQSCRNIKRELIITVLHNTVVINQAKWDLNSASNYLEGLIYNIQITNSSKNCSKVTILDETVSSASRLEPQDTYKYIELAQYYLQYCAINSQLRKHKNSQIAAKKAIKTLTLVFKNTVFKVPKVTDKQENQARKNIFRYLLQLSPPKLNEPQNLPNLLCFCQKIWKNELGSVKKTPIQQQCKFFSIGNVMSLQFKQIGPQKQNSLKKSIYYQNILLSIAIFSLSTEIRFETCEKNIQSKHYHTLSIILYYILFPFSTPYVGHIKENYIKNFGQFPSQIHAISFNSFQQLWDKIKRQSILNSSLPLPQSSINTIQQEKRKNCRLKHQNERLKNICLAQHQLPKPHSKSQDKAKSLTISHSNAKKLSVDSKKKPKNHHHKANLEERKQLNYLKKMVNILPLKKQANISSNQDEQGQFYFQMAFRKQKIKSPTHSSRKNSIRSTSSTTKDRSDEQVNKKKSKQLAKIKSKKQLIKK